MKSRKVILTVIAVLGAILGVFKTTFGLAIDQTAVIAGLAAVLVYVLFEAKADFQRVSSQTSKLKDPKFLITVISAVLAALQSSGVALPIPTETIIAVLTAIVGILFKVQTPKTA